MKVLLATIAVLWRQKPLFKVALLYLVALSVLVLVLPLLPLPYTPNELDLQQVFQRPFSWSQSSDNQPVHWLGTDALGRDVFVNILYGARTAFLISIPVMSLSSMLGLTAGAYAGFFGDKGLTTSRAGILAALCTLFVLLYYGLYLPLRLASFRFSAGSIVISLFLLLLILLLLWIFVLPLGNRLPVLKAKIMVPLDRLTLLFIAVLTSIPRLILILLLASFMPPSLLLLSAILIMTYWTGVARLARAEMLRIKQLPFFESAQGIGATNKRLVFRHALPNMLTPIFVNFTFGVAGLMALESTLSFLGIGIPGTLASWGRTISGVRSNTAAWWLVVFPGSFLALTVLALQTCSYYILAQFKNRRQQ